MTSDITLQFVLSEYGRTAPTLDDVERLYIIHVYDMCRGRVHLAAKILRIDPKTLYMRLRRYGKHLTRKDRGVK
jgi:transcriptional regulator of acetoin/glycerol metabolism